MPHPSPTSRWFELSGPRLHASEWPGDDPPVLLLHPNRTNGRIWDPFARACGHGRRMIALDHRGHGRSEWPSSGYQLADYVADELEVLEQLAVDAPVSLVGAATGGTIALLLASQRPELIRDLVVVDPGLRLDPAINREVQEQLVRDYRQPSRVAAVAAMPFSERWTPQVKEEFADHSLVEQPDGGWTWRYLLAAAQETEHALEQDVLPEVVVRCPTLVVRGEHSNVFDGERVAALAERLGPHEVVDIPGADHRVMQDNPTGLAAAVDTFLARRGTPIS